MPIPPRQLSICASTYLSAGLLENILSDQKRFIIDNPSPIPYSVLIESLTQNQILTFVGTYHD